MSTKLLSNWISLANIYGALIKLCWQYNSNVNVQVALPLFDIYIEPVSKQWSTHSSTCILALLNIKVVLSSITLSIYSVIFCLHPSSLGQHMNARDVNRKKEIVFEWDLILIALCLQSICVNWTSLMIKTWNAHWYFALSATFFSRRF